MNKKAIAKLNWIIKNMNREAAKREAPVNKIHEITLGDPFRTLVFTILSSRTKDETTIKAARKLLDIAATAYHLAGMHEEEIEHLIYGVGFYKVKAKNLRKMARILILQYNGIVPERMEELVKFPGVGRKTANIVRAYVFNREAIPVDVHVHRISNRLGIVKTKKPEETEKALMKIIPKRHWIVLNHTFVAYGQTVCLPRKPNCKDCRLRSLCMRIDVR